MNVSRRESDEFNDRTFLLFFALRSPGTHCKVSNANMSVCVCVGVLKKKNQDTFYAYICGFKLFGWWQW